MHHQLILPDKATAQDFLETPTLKAVAPAEPDPRPSWTSFLTTALAGQNLISELLSFSGASWQILSAFAQNA